MNKRIRHLSAFIIAILSCHVSFAALEQAADGYYIIKRFYYFYIRIEIQTAIMIYNPESCKITYKSIFP